ncbi:DUF16 domain-containing protein, partial [Mycoplasmoides pneumoniae]
QLTETVQKQGEQIKELQVQVKAQGEEIKEIKVEQKAQGQTLQLILKALEGINKRLDNLESK